MSDSNEGAGPAVRRRDLWGTIGYPTVATAAFGGVGAACATDSIAGAGRSPVSALDFIESEADRAAIAAGTYEEDLTGVLHSALDQIQAAGGGVLYFPRGLYPCNLILGGDAQRTRVHLRGEVRGATRFKSFAAGGFAIQDIVSINNVGWPPLETYRRSISDITFLGESKTRCGLFVANKNGTETTNLMFYQCLIGLMVCDVYFGTHLRPFFWGCDVGAWFGSVTGTLTTPNVTVPSYQGGGQAAPALLIGSSFSQNRVGLLALGDDDTPMLRLTTGNIETNLIGIFVPNAPAGLATSQTRKIWGGIYIENMWFETNGASREGGVPGAGTETVNGWVGDRGDIHLGKGMLHADGIFTEQVTVAGSGMLYADNAIYNRSGDEHVRWTVPLYSAIFDRADGDGGKTGFIGPIVKRPMPNAANGAPGGGTTTAIILPKHAFGRHPKAIIADRCDGTGFPAEFLSVTPERWTFQVADGPIATTCWQVDAPTGATTNVDLNYAYSPSKAYLLMVAVKAIDVGVKLEAYGNTVVDGGKWIPPDEWLFVAYASVAAIDAGGTIHFGVQNQSGVPWTIRFGGIALLEFNTKEEAAEVCASDFFPVL